MKAEVKKNEKKKAIIETAYKLFKSAGVSSTAIDDVVKAAGIARGTFYLYFKDKSDLLEQLIFMKSTESVKLLLRATFETINKENLSFIQSIGVFIDMYIDFLEQHKDVLTIVTKNISACLKSLPEFADEEAGKMYDEIVQYFVNYGFEEKKAHITIYILVDMIGSACSDVILTGKPFTISQIRADVRQAAINVVTYAVKTDKESGNEQHD